MISLNSATCILVVGKGEFGGNVVCCALRDLLGMISHAEAFMKTYFSIPIVLLLIYDLVQWIVISHFIVDCGCA